MSVLDRGSVTIVALVVIVLGASSIASLTALNVAVIDAHASQSRLDALELRADSELSLVASRLRILGADPNTVCPSPMPESNEIDVRITCSTTGSADHRLPSGLVATLNSSTIAAQTLPAWAGGIDQAITGAVVINTGTSSSPAISYLPDRRPSADPPSIAGWQSIASDWTPFAVSGDVTDPLPYPYLPRVPTFERPGAQSQFGSCSAYFPGRYLGTSSLVLNGGQHYFTSGVYYFERTLTISGGARVVMGSGKHEGCTNDTDVAADGRAPRRHEMSGSGVTLVFGAAARLVVQESSLIINARDGEASIRTVGFGTSNSSVMVPPDSVLLDDGSVVLASAHTVHPPGSSTPVAYKSSTLTASTSFAVDIRLNGSIVQTNQVIIEGQVFVPHAGLRLSSTTSSYGISLTGGIVTTRLTTSLPVAPSGVGAGFDLGSTVANPTTTRIAIDVHASDDRRSFTSGAVFDTGEQWRLVGRSRRHQPTTRGT